MSGVSDLDRVAIEAARTVTTTPNDAGGVSVRQAAEQLGVEPWRVKMARQVLRADEALAERVAGGELRLTKAEYIVRRRRPKALAAGKGSVLGKEGELLALEAARTVTSIRGSHGGVTVAEAARVHGLPHWAVRKANHLLRHAPEAAERVRKGKVGLSVAFQESRPRGGPLVSDARAAPAGRADLLGRPSYLNHFYRWLMGGRDAVAACGDPGRFAALAASHGVALDHDLLRATGEFLLALAEATGRPSPAGAPTPNDAKDDRR